MNVGVLKFSEEEMSVTLDIRYPKNGDAELVQKLMKVYKDNTGRDD